MEDAILLLVLTIFFSFSLTASSIYILNDLKDYHRDRLHPEKCRRPLVTGEVSRDVASLVAVLLLIPSWTVAYAVSTGFLILTILYFGIQVFYTLYLKEIPLIDVFCIAAGFVLRVLAGGAAYEIKVSPWLFLSIFLLSVVLAAGKRLSEVKLLDVNASSHRESLRGYKPEFLREILLVSSSASLITYSLYTIEESSALIYTVPVVTFGLFRYLSLTHRGLGDATEVLLKDRTLSITVATWLILVWYLRY